MSISISLAMLAAAAAASAPPSTEKPKAHASNQEADVSLAGYADCVVRDAGRRAAALRYLRVVDSDPQAGKLVGQLITPDCLDKSLPNSVGPNGSERSDRAGVFSAAPMDLYALKMQPSAFRNALYPALYRYSFSRSGPGNIAGKPPLSVSSEWEVVPDPLPEGWRIRRTIGDCMARGHPMAAHRFVLSKPWSPAEESEIGEITTALAECLPEGQTVSVGREDLRGIVGEALYKLASAPKASPATAGSPKPN